MFSFWKKPTPAPQPNRIGMFRTIVDEAIGNVTHDADWSTKCEVAKTLEDFASILRLEIATRRPL